MQRIVLASRNPKKSKELRELLVGLPFEVIGLESFPDCPEVIEDGDTFEANSAKKALEVAAFTGEWAVADDSGLEVDALGGEPGVYSARYGGLSDDAQRNLFLLKNLEPFDSTRRSARFVCCATLAADGIVLFQHRSTCEGEILDSPRGDHGFGYDPIFQPSGLSVAMAELPPEQKHRISHRGRAFVELRRFLEGFQ